MCEILIDRKVIAHFVRSQVVELREGSLFIFKNELRKNFSKKIMFRPISDLDPDPNPDPDLNPDPCLTLDPDLKLNAGWIRIQHQIQNFCFGSATLTLTKSKKDL